MNTANKPSWEIGQALLKGVGILTLITASLALKNAEGGNDHYGVNQGFNLLWGTAGLVDRKAKEEPSELTRMADLWQNAGY